MFAIKVYGIKLSETTSRPSSVRLKDTISVKADAALTPGTYTICTIFIPKSDRIRIRYYQHSTASQIISVRNYLLYLIAEFLSEENIISLIKMGPLITMSDGMDI